MSKIIGGEFARKLESAVRRNGVTLEDINFLSRGKNFRAVTLLRTRRAELTPIVTNESEEWVIDNEGYIRFTVISNGFSGEHWEQYFLSNNLGIDDSARDILGCVAKPATKDVSYNIAVYPGYKLSEGDSPYKAYDKAIKKGWVDPHWEVACLIHNAFNSRQWKDMRMKSIVTMHRYIKNSNGIESFLCTNREGAHGLLRAFEYRILGRFNEIDDGLAFVVPQAKCKRRSRSRTR